MTAPTVGTLALTFLSHRAARRLLTLPDGIGYGWQFHCREQLRFDSRRIRRARVRAYRLRGFSPEAQIAPLLYALNRHVARLQRRVGRTHDLLRYGGHRGKAAR